MAYYIPQSTVTNLLHVKVSAQSTHFRTKMAHIIITAKTLYVRIHKAYSQAGNDTFRVENEMILNFNSYPVPQAHKEKSVVTTKELFSTLPKRDVLKLKTMNKSIHKIIHFISNTCRPIIEIMYLRLQMRSVGYHS